MYLCVCLWVPCCSCRAIVVAGGFFSSKNRFLAGPQLAFGRWVGPQYLSRLLVIAAGWQPQHIGQRERVCKCARPRVVGWRRRERVKGGERQRPSAVREGPPRGRRRAPHQAKSNPKTMEENRGPGGGPAIPLFLSLSASLHSPPLSISSPVRASN